ncbi:hypothetical protein ApDm4_0800 [Acetobacter pomorum]|nr:hypothetical protein ApDm4_0800 [Acetobacter pomorum]
MTFGAIPFSRHNPPAFYLLGRKAGGVWPLNWCNRWIPRII